MGVIQNIIDRCSNDNEFYRSLDEIFSIPSLYSKCLSATFNFAVHGEYSGYCQTTPATSNFLLKKPTTFVANKVRHGIKRKIQLDASKVHSIYLSELPAIYCNQQCGLYRRNPLSRTLTGPAKKFEIANIRDSWKFEVAFFKVLGKPNTVFTSVLTLVSLKKSRREKIYRYFCSNWYFIFC